ncbi:MAG: luxS [Firmicutes bacterium]|nr:luxS [Bacillota bacterium]
MWASNCPHLSIQEEMSMKIESFELDHTKIVAPFVRKAGLFKGEKGDYVTKFDLRFVQPNLETMPSAAIHTLEHLLAGYLREEIDGIIDMSPMGCRTGFYLTIWGDVSEEDMKKALIAALDKVVESTEVPAVTAKECGNYRDHSLFSAVEYAKYVGEGLKQGKGKY